MPMTTFGGDGQASASKKPGHNPTMNDESNIEDVEQDVTNKERYEDVSLTAEPPESLEEAGFDSDKVGEDDPIDTLKEGMRELSETVEDLPPLPTEEEAEMGELYRVPTEGPFQFCELVDEDTATLIEAFDSVATPKGATDQEVREAVEAVEGGAN